MILPILKLHPSRHKRVAGGHPWVFSNELVMDATAKNLPVGGLVRFIAHDGTHLGTGCFNPRSLIAGRIFSRAPLAVFDKDWFVQKLSAALRLRERLVTEPFYRLVHAEADGLPGLIIDRFGPHFSLSMNCAGMDNLTPAILEALEELFHPESLVLHNDSPVRELEGLPREIKVLKGRGNGLIEVRENGLSYFADIWGGQKTGWYFDQRDNHAMIAALAPGKSVLDLYCHAGGFGLLAAARGAVRVVGVDSSAPALAMAEQAAAHGGLAPLCQWVKADAFEDLERRIAAKESFDIVIADPPPFVRSRKDLAAGARGYRKLAKLSAQLTAPEGLLFIASCSHNMDLATFTQEVAKGLAEAGREGRILKTVGAASDHPVHPHVPESAYLKGFLIALTNK